MLVQYLLETKRQLLSGMVLIMFLLVDIQKFYRQIMERNLSIAKLKSYIEGIGVDHIFGAPYHPQSQDTIEALNKKLKELYFLHMIMSYKKKMNLI